MLELWYMFREEQEKKVVDTENLPEQKIDQIWNLL